MAWIQKLKNVLKTRKVKLFFVFLTCSFLAWFISNLSESYTSNAVFDLKFVNVPENRMLLGTSKKNVDVKLEAVGFQFLGFNFKNKEVDIDISDVLERGRRPYITHEQYRKQIEKQLSSSMRILEMDNDTLFLDLKELFTKDVLVKPNIKMGFAQNYLLDGELQIEPNSITITGPKEEVSAISSIPTAEVSLGDLSENFSQTITVLKPEELVNSSLSSESVVVRGKVAKFSEKIIEVPVEVNNIPKNMNMRTFPEKVKVLCKAKLGVLKNLNSNDFKVVADYNEILESKDANKIPVRLLDVPQNIYGATLVEKSVEYILRNK